MDSFVWDGERGLSVHVEIGKEPGGEDVWQRQRDLEGSETKTAMRVVSILGGVCHSMFFSEKHR